MRGNLKTSTEGAVYFSILLLRTDGVEGLECGIAGSEEELRKAKRLVEEAACKADKKSKCSGGGGGEIMFISQHCDIHYLYVVFLAEFYFIGGGADCSGVEATTLTEVPDTVEGITCTLVPKEIGAVLLRDLEVQKKWCIEEFIGCWSVKG